MEDGVFLRQWSKDGGEQTRGTTARRPRWWKRGRERRWGMPEKARTKPNGKPASRGRKTRDGKVGVESKRGREERDRGAVEDRRPISWPRTPTTSATSWIQRRLFSLSFPLHLTSSAVAEDVPRFTVSRAGRETERERIAKGVRKGLHGQRVKRARR